MNTDPQVAPVAETQNVATEPQTEESAAEAQPQASEKDERDKAIARMERRINRKHAEAASASERARIAEDRLRDYESRQPQQQREPIQVDPREVQSYVETRAEAIASHRELTKTVNSVVSKGNERYKDFDDATGALAQEVPFYTRTGQPTPQLAAILESDDPPALIHYLGSNPDVAAELADLTPSQLTRRLIKLEGELKAPARQPSSAPKPLEPVKSSGSKGEPDPTKDREGWIKWRNANAKS